MKIPNHFTKRSSILLVMLVALSFCSYSQPYNYYNEWIDYNKTYYKFKIAVTGLYRIKQPVLATAGLGSVPAEQFQLWRNGQQVPIYTSVQTGPMGGSDYIEFWGEINDGKPDKDLYRIADHQINDAVSMETDTASYFLTVNPGSGNLRLTPAVNALPTSLAPESFFVYTTGKYYRDKYNLGYTEYAGDPPTPVYSSDYERGEGFTSTDIGRNITLSATFPNLFPYTGSGAPAPSLRISAAGNALNQRSFEVKVNGSVVANQAMDFFDYVKINVPLTIGNISSGSAAIDIKNLCLNTPDRMVIGQTELQYPRQFNFGGATNFVFELAANTAGNYLEITGFNYGSSTPVLYDLTNGKRYVVNTALAPVLRVVLEPSSTARKLVMVTQENTYPVDVTALQQRSFINYSLAANRGDYIIITHQALLNGSNGSTPVNAYRDYRASAAGGSYNAKIYLIDQLTDQFGYGIKNHPLSVRNFLRWARANFGIPIKDVFLVGKGLQYIHNNFYQSNPNLDKLSFIPTFGYPASDNLLAADPGMDVMPKLPLGRLSVITGDEVTVYLQKVIQYEQKLAFQSPLIADKAWQKNVVHVIGSGDGVLGDQLTAAMNGYSAIVSDTFYGGNVNTFTKVSTAPVEQLSPERLSNLFSSGIGMLTYFGHSSATVLEFNLDNPDGYSNTGGKYPVFILLGCSAGNFFNFEIKRLSVKETISEKFVLANDRGSIATLASTHTGIVNFLDLYNTATMKAASVRQYGKTLGEVINDAVSQVYTLTTQGDYFSRLHCEETTLHGDPALKMMASYPKPDYVIEDPLVEVNPAFISVAENSFIIKAKFINLGKAINQPVVIEMKRTYPDQTTTVRRDTIPGIRYIDSLAYTIPILATRDKGANKVSICIDPDNKIDELYETNNCVTKDFFIYEDEIRPVYPYNLAIINKQGIKFQASTANPFSPLRQYTMEIDTTKLFNSSFKRTQTVSSVGGILEFNPAVTFTDSTVYYWRVAPVPVSGPPVWNTASFVYLPGSDLGFNQSHYFQHTESSAFKINLNAQSRQWNFDSVQHYISARNIVSDRITIQEGQLVVEPDGDAYIRSACWGYSLVFNLFDPRSFQAATNPSGFMGSWGPPCQPSRQWNFEWRYLLRPQRKQMMDFMDWIPDGTIVVVRSINNDLQTTGFVDEWKADTSAFGSGNSLYHKLKAVGMNVLDSFTSTKAMIFMYQKGHPEFGPVDTVSRGMLDDITLRKYFKTPGFIGDVTSPVYGPAKRWKQLIWRGAADGVQDTATVDVIGIRSNGTEQTIFSGLTPAQQNVDISSIDPGEYPSLKLMLHSKDSGNYTPYQLRYWRVTYDPVPEGAIAPNIFLTVKDTVDVGEPFDYKVGFKNISEAAFDSVKVKLVITDRNNVPHIIPIPKQRPLPVNDMLQIGAQVKTESLPGRNVTYIEANPDNDQPEQFHFNNFAYRNLYVKPDSLNPLLDVTFDGIHILNRDIVSSKPNILVKLKDEAKWMILDDTSLLTLQVRYPNGTLRRFYFNNDTVRFTPAGQAPNADNTATIDFRPYFPLDGEYEMMITGRDKSNNKAGVIEYRVIFEVINKPMISNMLNYPNPFTTSTAFVFTITGSEVPQNIKIEIMTVTGKIVREITKGELGPLNIGRNITEFKWDGTDQYGQKLANGVYLYRVITNLNGKSLDKYKAEDDNTDKYFNKGYGKMYLMR